METVVFVIYLMVVVALVGVILLQRSEGGALGMGGGGLMSSRGTANVLTRATTILAALFFLGALVLAILARTGTDRPGSILDNPPVPSTATPGAAAPAAPTSGGILDQLQKTQTSQPTPAPAPAPAAPKAETPATPAAPAAPVEAPKVEAPKAETPAPAPAPAAPKAETPAPAAPAAPATEQPKP